MAITQIDQLRVYRRSFDAAMQIFEGSKEWPPEEKYSLTDQVRRSSRSVSANLAEAWRRRRYPKHFISKLSDADAEAAETRVWLRFSVRCGYMTQADFERLDQTYNNICGGLVIMMTNPSKMVRPCQSR